MYIIPKGIRDERDEREKRTMRRQTAKQFFFKHAGWSYSPAEETAVKGRWRCAEALAEAEAYAQEHDWTFDWEWDSDADLSFMTDEEREKEHECLMCTCVDTEHETLASLCGIVDADANYRRVVEAELASEALADIRRRDWNELQIDAMEREAYAI